MRCRVLVSARYVLPVPGACCPIFEENAVGVMAAPVRERLTKAGLLPLVGGVDGAVCRDDRFAKRVLWFGPMLDQDVRSPDVDATTSVDIGKIWP